MEYTNDQLNRITDGSILRNQDEARYGRRSFDNYRPSLNLVESTTRDADCRTTMNHHWNQIRCLVHPRKRTIENQSDTILCSPFNLAILPLNLNLVYSESSLSCSAVRNEKL
uniref:Uncharacterized protein n=1 Tax=Cucumis melo TaxID=3656 RepID=A0A9I9EIM4_CUCME